MTSNTMRCWKFPLIQFALILATLLQLPSIVSGTPKPIQNIQVTLRGEVYSISQVTTADELQERLEEESGIERLDQGKVTFQGQVLNSGDNLSDIGMKDGDQVNMVPKKMADHWVMIKDMGTGLMNLQRHVLSKGVTASQKEREELQVMQQLFEDVLKVPYMQDEMERFSDHLRKPTTVERATDPERIEQLRQVILNNPLLLKYMQRNRASREAIQDENTWFQYIVKSVEGWKNMTGYELWQRLMDGTFFGGES